MLAPNDRNPYDLDDEDGDDGAELQRLRDVAGFVAHAIVRNRRKALACFAGVGAIAALALALAPKTYHTESRLLAQQNLVMPALGNPKRAVPTDADAPTRLAAETIKKRDHIIAMIKESNLMDEWPASRAPILKAKDAVLQAISGPPAEEDRLEALIWLVSQRLQVVADEGTVKIGIDWPDPNMGYRLIESAQQNFLEARHAQEVSMIAETISIIEGHAARLRESIDQLVANLHPPPEKGGAAEKPTTKPAPADNEAAQTRVMIMAKRKAIADLEEFRQRRLTELQTQLAEQRNVYGPAHPAIANTQQNIQALSGDSPQLIALRREEKQLADELTRRAARPAAPARQESKSEVSELPALPTEIARAAGQRRDGEPEDSELVSYQKARLRLMLQSYEELLGRIGSARIELDTARAAFKYRYSVIVPAQVSKRPDKPKALAFIVGGAGLAVLASIALALWSDLRRRRFLEAWQVEAVLRVPLLGVVRQPVADKEGADLKQRSGREGAGKEGAQSP